MAPSLQTSLSPPLIGSPSDRAGSLGRHFLSVVLSVCLCLFLADAVISLADDSLRLFGGVHVLGGIRVVVFGLALLITVLTYGLMGLTPIIPKRIFLPLTLFNPVTVLASLPLLVLFYDRIQQLAWTISLCQVGFGLVLLSWAGGGFKRRWPVVAESRLGRRAFSWSNLWGFVLANVLLVPPVVLVCLFLSTSLAVHHFSDGFVTLHPGGLIVQVREYTRDDGKRILLVPMSHIGELNFYRDLSQSFPTNALVLMEGVTDRRNLITNSVNYARMASSLGLVEQQEEFTPSSVAVVHADVDVEEFAAETIGFMNLIMLGHSKGMTPEVVRQMLQYTPPPGFERQLFADLLAKRNQHLLDELHARLPEWDLIIVPWGAAHMPEIAERIQASGFRLRQTWDYEVIRFGSGDRGTGAG